eukprot:Opistho-2@57803
MALVGVSGRNAVWFSVGIRMPIRPPGVRSSFRFLATQPSPFAALCNEALLRVKRTTINSLHSIDPTEKRVLIDVRETNEWAEGRIPGAVHLPRGIAERDVHKVTSDFDTPLYVYCQGGLRSALVVDNLAKMGYKHAVSVDGGYAEWAKRGYPVEK